MTFAFFVITQSTFAAVASQPPAAPVATLAFVNPSPTAQLQTGVLMSRLPAYALAHSPDIAAQSWVIGLTVGAVTGSLVGYAVGRRSGTGWGVVAGTLSTAIVAVVVTLVRYVVLDG